MGSVDDFEEFFKKFLDDNFSTTGTATSSSLEPATTNQKTDNSLNGVNAITAKVTSVTTTTSISTTTTTTSNGSTSFSKTNTTSSSNLPVTSIILKKTKTFNGDSTWSAPTSSSKADDTKSVTASPEPTSTSKNQTLKRPTSPGTTTPVTQKKTKLDNGINKVQTASPTKSNKPATIIAPPIAIPPPVLPSSPAITVPSSNPPILPAPINLSLVPSSNFSTITIPPPPPGLPSISPAVATLRSFLRGRSLTTAQTALLLQRIRSNPQYLSRITGSSASASYPINVNLTTIPTFTSTPFPPSTAPIASTSQSALQNIVPTSQPPTTLTFQHVTQKAYEILKPISPPQFTDAFLESGVFKADKMDPSEPQYYDIIEYIFNSQAHQSFGVDLISVLKITQPSTPSSAPSTSTSTVTSPTATSSTQTPQVTSPTNRFTMMLWHGTKPRSVASILKEGFRCPQTGSQMFGKGVYFADRISKSAQYCNQSSYVCIPKPGEIGYLFLCEVTLGQCYNAKNVKHSYKSAPQCTKRDGSVMTFDSLKCTGLNVPDRQKQREIDGIIWPLGPTIKNTRFPSYTVLYNEFIVYNPEMVKIKYLVQVQFK